MAIKNKKPRQAAEIGQHTRAIDAGCRCHYPGNQQQRRKRGKGKKPVKPAQYPVTGSRYAGVKKVKINETEGPRRR